MSASGAPTLLRVRLAFSHFDELPGLIDQLVRNEGISLHVPTRVLCATGKAAPRKVRRAVMGSDLGRF
jgi:hypothetical protein